MDISEGHPSGVDVGAFMQEVEPQIHDKLEEEIFAFNENQVSACTQGPAPEEQPRR